MGTRKSWERLAALHHPVPGADESDERRAGLLQGYCPTILAISNISFDISTTIVIVLILVSSLDGMRCWEPTSQETAKSITASMLNPRPCIPAKPQTPDPKPGTPNPKQETRNNSGKQLCFAREELRPVGARNIGADDWNKLVGSILY